MSSTLSKDAKIYIAGHNGMVGSAIWRTLTASGYTNLIGQSSQQLDLRNQDAVNQFMEATTPDVVIVAAAKVGGILANSQFQYQFLLENLQIQNNIIDAAHRNNTKKLIFLGSSCIYPKLAQQPLTEDSLLTGPLEPTNEGYAIAKIAGVKLCQHIKNQYNKDFVSLMPTNLYGSNDNFDLKTSHVLPAMIRKFHDAKLDNNAPVTLWGSGTPMREFLFVDDLAQAVLFAMQNQLPDHLYNVGTGTDITIKQLATTIQKATGHTGPIIWDSTKPDGTPRKLMDVSKLKQAGWQYTTNLEQGIAKTYQWFLDNHDTYKQVKL